VAALSSARDAQPMLIVPPAAAPGTLLMFELKVSDGASTSVADAVSVLVTEASEPPPADAGTPPDPAPIDAGSPPVDAGAAPIEPAAPVDAAPPPTDANAQPVEPVQPLDAALPAPDAGPPPIEPAAPADAAAALPDASATPSPAEPAPADASVAPGPAPFDAGAAPDAEPVHEADAEAALTDPMSSEAQPSDPSAAGAESESAAVTVDATTAIDDVPNGAHETHGAAVSAPAELEADKSGATPDDASSPDAESGCAVAPGAPPSAAPLLYVLLALLAARRRARKRRKTGEGAGAEYAGPSGPRCFGRPPRFATVVRAPRPRAV
jgi:MYXO-CTERM domain-containing protein